MLPMSILILVAKVACHLLSSYCGEASVLQVQDFDNNHSHLAAVLSKPHPRPLLFGGYCMDNLMKGGLLNLEVWFQECVEHAVPCKGRCQSTNGPCESEKFGKCLGNTSA